MGGDYVELGSTVSDNYDIGLVATVNSRRPARHASATYTVTYNVTDSRGQRRHPVTRTVNVVDTTPPVITLTGANPQVIEVGTAYVELGSTACPTTYDVDLEATVDITRRLARHRRRRTRSPTDVIDANDNPADPVTRTVNVVDTTAPVITLVGCQPPRRSK